MKIIVCKDSNEVAKKAYEVMKDVVVNKPNAVLGLATGSSPIGLYNEMIADYKAGNVSYKDVSSFNLDEYVGIPKDHPESYETFMHKQLFDHIDINPANTHLPYGDTQADCDAYEKAMSDVSVDIQVLGIGRNGHIGFNEPGTSFDSLTHIVDLQEKTIEDNARFFDGNMDLVPKKAITMGIATIMKAKKILLVATGEGKADAVAAMKNGPITEDMPASILQKHDDCVVFVDEAAASKL
ncbi:MULTISPECIES: glucosamine-6-phosphate deaminase [Breznakia]|uniref:Glucosamine-6-phosphate deaminase n=1 Tax=Breznakia blatticola TaxID=1754012 RepID=A0A4R8AC10_9FIRM|nr:MULTISPECIES: glucosamine-6-phosphate deaminase [Breznakia]MDH6368127.1 glucosamine-6-phosphate deaminase [Breznakia sp. PH1-1]MDH6405216.1 glucosamine-6-phosphate deaminase [Breznakia sp. PF1-11]MDH6412931.1 glucosamine-6-phosphate deaminase [Breznakia sp. PFB1-11]MDH6415293.1 glucosamine-6-phosphate deaminase [Breznakia sp. PFB1-14]MDH6417601.1 glucosamine-6-phosphate deaminase [Breznakia sp. PFB1-4]